MRTSPKPSSSRSKVTVVLLVLLSLFLVGTVLVLSFVSYYFAIPSTAYLTEDEVTWISEGVIKPLLYEPPSTPQQHRRQEEIVTEDNVEEEWTEIEEALGLGLNVSAPADIVEIFSDDAEWDIDGQGTGGYWMRKDWSGHVEGTHEWSRLDNITAGSGERIPRLIHQTWKDDILPEKWRKAWKECREGMPD